jgi:hypothetical protein
MLHHETSWFTFKAALVEAAATRDDLPLKEAFPVAPFAVLLAKLFVLQHDHPDQLLDNVDGD